jgi:hypothetical protein
MEMAVSGEDSVCDVLSLRGALSGNPTRQITGFFQKPPDSSPLIAASGDGDQAPGVICVPHHSPWLGWCFAFNRLW